MVIATFRPTTDWSGSTITLEGELFTLQDHGPISAADVLAYDRQGFLDWTNDWTRAWVESKAAAPQVSGADAPTGTVGQKAGALAGTATVKAGELAGAASVAVGNAMQTAKIALAGARTAVKAQRSSALSSPEAAPGVGEPPAASSADEIARLAGLHAKGVLTDEEFAAFKAKLVG